MSIFKTVISFSLVLSGVSAFAIDQVAIEKSVKLKDGSTVHVFKDSTMAMEDTLGCPFRMKPDQTMQTTDDESIVMKGDEVARLSNGQRAHMKR